VQIPAPQPAAQLLPKIIVYILAYFAEKVKDFVIFWLNLDEISGEKKFLAYVLVLIFLYLFIGLAPS